MSLDGLVVIKQRKEYHYVSWMESTILTKARKDSKGYGISTTE